MAVCRASGWPDKTPMEKPLRALAAVCHLGDGGHRIHLDGCRQGMACLTISLTVQPPTEDQLGTWYRLTETRFPGHLARPGQGIMADTSSIIDDATTGAGFRAQNVQALTGRFWGFPIAGQKMTVGKSGAAPGSHSAKQGRFPQPRLSPRHWMVKCEMDSLDDANL